MSALADWFASQTTGLQKNLAGMGGPGQPAAQLKSSSAPTVSPASTTGVLTGGLFSGGLSDLLSFSDDVMIGALGVLMIVVGIWGLVK